MAIVAYTMLLTGSGGTSRLQPWAETWQKLPNMLEAVSARPLQSIVRDGPLLSGEAGYLNEKLVPRISLKLARDSAVSISNRLSDRICESWPNPDVEPGLWVPAVQLDQSSSELLVAVGENPGTPNAATPSTRWSKLPFPKV